MKSKHIRWVMAPLSFFLASSALAEPPPAPPPKYITIEADLWCPINCDPDKPLQGIGIDLAKKVFEPLGYQIDYKLVPWTQALKDARSGKVDAVVGANHNDDPTLIFPNTPVYNITDDFYVVNGNAWRYQGPYTLKGQRVGVVANYGYGEVVRKFIAENRAMVGIVQEATGENALKDNIDKLLARKITVLIESKPVMDYTLQKLGLSSKIQWAGGVPQAPVFLAFSPAKPESKALAAQYDAAMKRLIDSGALESFYKPYGIKP